VIDSSQLARSEDSSWAPYKWEHPVVYRVNWLAILLLAAYLVATALYAYHRVTALPELGPYFRCGLCASWPGSAQHWRMQLTGTSTCTAQAVLARAASPARG
jgi:hypothetical protein